MSYNRKIFYMSFYESDEKRGNAGYIKVQQKGDAFEAEVRLSGVSPLFDGETELKISLGQELVTREKIAFRNGRGIGNCRWERPGKIESLNFLLPLSGDCYLGTGEMQKQSIYVPKTMERLPEETVQEGTEEVLIDVPQPQVEILEEREETVEVQAPSKGEDKESKEAKEKVENRKWKQICKVYPHTRPFDDFREYIKLDLKDMVLVSEKKYSLVENSFLLHGYYNYHHVILWKKEKTPVKYYIGVPGNFYEKEKQVAVLYGFESFEGAVEPAREGDFGYYMTEVSI